MSNLQIGLLFSLLVLTFGFNTEEQRLTIDDAFIGLYADEYINGPFNQHYMIAMVDYNWTTGEDADSYDYFDLACFPSSYDTCGSRGIYFSWDMFDSDEVAHAWFQPIVMNQDSSFRYETHSSSNPFYVSQILNDGPGDGTFIETSPSEGSNYAQFIGAINFSGFERYDWDETDDFSDWMCYTQMRGRREGDHWQPGFDLTDYGTATIDTDISDLSYYGTQNWTGTPPSDSYNEDYQCQCNYEPSYPHSPWDTSGEEDELYMTTELYHRAWNDWHEEPILYVNVGNNWDN